MGGTTKAARKGGQALTHLYARSPVSHRAGAHYRLSGAQRVHKAVWRFQQTQFHRDPSLLFFLPLHQASRVTSGLSPLSSRMHLLLA